MLLPAACCLPRARDRPRKQFAGRQQQQQIWAGATPLPQVARSVQQQHDTWCSQVATHVNCPPPPPPPPVCSRSPRRFFGIPTTPLPCPSSMPTSTVRAAAAGSAAGAPPLPLMLMLKLMLLVCAVALFASDDDPFLSCSRPSDHQRTTSCCARSWTSWQRPTPTSGQGTGLQKGRAKKGRA